MTDFLAYRCHNDEGRVTARLDSLPRPDRWDLAAGDVQLRVAWSGINYKDALAVTGAGKIMRRFPLTAGIDAAGVVEASADVRVRQGAPVIVVGCGLGEEHDGGFAEYVRVRGDWVVPLPPALTLRDAMALGTAGFTAGQSVLRMEDNGLAPTAGPIAVTGASGGVGSVAIAVLAQRGYHVVAITGKSDAADYLRTLGAADVMAASAVPDTVRPLEPGRWAGAIDTLGGSTLSWLCASTQPLGNIAVVGLARSHSLNTTVMPLILRGVNLLGINSTYCPVPLRDRVWTCLAEVIAARPGLLDHVVRRTVNLADLPGAFDGYTARQVTGRTLVRVSGALR